VKLRFPDPGIMSLLSSSDRLEAWRLLLTILVTAIVDVLGVASILPFMAIAAKPEIVQSNTWVQAAYSWGGFASVDQFLFFAGVAFFLLLVAANLLAALSAWLLYRFAFALEQRLSERLLASYLARPYKFFLSANSSIMAKNVLAESASVVGGVIVPGLQLIARGAVVFCVLALLMMVDPRLAVTVTLVLGIAYGATYLLIRRKLLANGQLSNDAHAQNFKAANEALNGFKEIRILGKEEVFLSRFSKSSLDNARYKVIGSTLSSLPRYAIETIAFGGMLLILLYLIGVKRDLTIALPLIALYALAGYRMLPAFQHIFLSLSQIRYHYPSLLLLLRELAPTVGHSDLLPSAQRLALNRTIEVDQVTFSYPGAEAPVLNDVSLSIAVNTSVALVGPTGSGKTTLLDIILCLLIPDNGVIRVDGNRLDADRLRQWQMSIGYVPQQIYLTDDTVARNIAFGSADGEIDMKAVIEAATAANLHGFIENELPSGYHTHVGERGIRLSGGQRQRIGIARALYHRPGVLVMDEATSALDGITERAVIEAIQTLSHKLTIIMVAHRLSTVKDCDLIYLLEKGRVAFKGNFAELNASSEVFRNMQNS
jgi:ABC-type multidrug transport system fused ATPase/permease subunit